MHRKSLLGRFCSPGEAARAERPKFLRALLEPLEVRRFLSVSTLNWVIDSANSKVTLAIPDQTSSVGLNGSNFSMVVRARDQSSSGSAGTWTTGNSASFSGTLAIDYVDGGQLQFKSGLNNFGEVDSANWRPTAGTQSVNPAYNPNIPDTGTSAYPFLYSNFTYTPNKHDGSGTFNTNVTSPAAFGMRENGTVTYPLVVFNTTLQVPVTADISYLSLSQIADNASSGILPISGGNFAANATNLSVTSDFINLQGLDIAGVGTPVSYVTTQPLLTLGANQASTGSVATTGALTRKLTLPINIPFNMTGPGNSLTGTMTGQLVANATLVAPLVDLNGNGAGTSFNTNWSIATGPVNIGGTLAAGAGSAILATDSINLAATGGLKASLATVHTGDVLAANTTGTNITATFAGGTLTLSGTDTTAHYEQVLRTITYDNTVGNVGSSPVTVRVIATDSFGLASPEADAFINTFEVNVPPTVDLNGGGPGTGFTSTWSGSVPIADPMAATIFDDGADLTSMTVKLTAPATGDVLSANTTGTTIAQSYANGTLSLTGTDTVADYQQVLRSITYNNTAGGPQVAVETATIVVTDNGPNAILSSAPVTATINMPAPNITLTFGAGTGTPNFTTSWYNSGSVPIANNAVAAVGSLAGVPNLTSLTVTLATLNAGDVLSVPILAGVAITSSYSSGTLTLSGNDTLAHYQQELHFINYNNTAGGPGVATKLATFVASDGTHTGTPVTATININVATGQVLGNRLFYNNSKYDGGAGAGNAAINANDDLAIASDKVGFSGTGSATFANVSAFSKGITGVMVDLQAGIGNHSLINLTSGDITFKVSPSSFVTMTYNQLSTWTAAPTPTAISVRLGAGTGGSDRLEITWASGAIKNAWLEVNVHSGGNTGLSADDVFYFGSVVGNSGTGDTASLSKTDVTDGNAALNNCIGLNTPVWNLADYSKDAKVDMTDYLVATNGTFTLNYLANPSGPFAPASAGGAAAPAATVAQLPGTNAVASGLSSFSGVNGGSINLPSWLGGRLQAVFASLPIQRILQSAAQLHPLAQLLDQPDLPHVHDDALDRLLADLGLE